MTSLPVPLSPAISTMLSVGATVSARRITSRNTRETPIGLTACECSRRWISCLSTRFSALSWRCSSARRQIAISSSLSNGFWM